MANILSNFTIRGLWIVFGLPVCIAVFWVVLDSRSLNGQVLPISSSQLHRQDTLDSRPVWCNRDAIDAMMSEPYFFSPEYPRDSIADIRLLAWNSDRIFRPDSVSFDSRNLLYVVVYRSLNGRISMLLVVLRTSTEFDSDKITWRIAQDPDFGVYLDSTSLGYDSIPPRNRRYPIVPYLRGWHVPPSLLRPDDISDDTLYSSDSTSVKAAPAHNAPDYYVGIETGSINYRKLWMRSEFLESPTGEEIDSFLTTPRRFYNTVPALRIIGLFEYGTFGTEECRYERIFEDGAVRERTWQHVFGFPPKKYLPKR
jgi:hypothetical protein